MIVELLLGIALGYIPCTSLYSYRQVYPIFFFFFLPLSDVDNFGKFPLLMIPASSAQTSPAHLGGFLMGLLVGTFFYPVISVTKRHKSVVWSFRLVALPLAIVLFVVSQGC
jgi:hypothetical protein